MAGLAVRFVRVTVEEGNGPFISWCTSRENGLLRMTLIKKEISE
jgi:hypothetical protein